MHVVSEGHGFIRAGKDGAKRLPRCRRLIFIRTAVRAKMTRLRCFHMRFIVDWITADFSTAVERFKERAATEQKRREEEQRQSYFRTLSSGPVLVSTTKRIHMAKYSGSVRGNAGGQCVAYPCCPNPHDEYHLQGSYTTSNRHPGGGNQLSKTFAEAYSKGASPCGWCYGNGTDEYARYLKEFLELQNAPVWRVRPEDDF